MTLRQRAEAAAKDLAGNMQRGNVQRIADAIESEALAFAEMALRQSMSYDLALACSPAAVSRMDRDIANAIAAAEGGEG